MVAVDRIPPSEILTTCALTLPANDPRVLSPSEPSSRGSSSFSPRTLSPSAPAAPTSTSPITASQLSRLSAGPTLLFQFDGLSRRLSLHHERILIQWLRHADILLGQNIAYDLMVLRAHSPRLRAVLSGRHFLVDLSVLNFLHSESRPEKSLKDLGPILGTHLYPDDEKSRRYRSPSDPSLHSYNGQDTHNTLISIAVLAHRILSEYPNTDKLSPFCLRLYSDLIWSVVRMTESGVPYHLPSLHALFTSLHASCFSADALCTSAGLLVDSRHKTRSGVAASQSSFLSSLLDQCPPSTPVAFTPKQSKLSVSDSNRTIIAAALPPTHPSQPLLSAWASFRKSQKLLSTYVYPLILSKRNDPSALSSILLSPTDPPLLPPPPMDLVAWNPWIPPSPAPSPSSLPPCPTGRSPSWTLQPSFDAPPPIWTATLSSSPSTTSSPVPPSPTSPPSKTATSPTSLPAPSGSVSPTAATSSPTKPPTSDIFLTHPSWFITPSPFKDSSSSEGGTLQSRITCKDSPEQTAPKIIQACRRSRSPSGCLLSMDLSQIELRVPALYSGEPSLIAAFTAGLDLHTERAIATFSRDYLLGKYPQLVDAPFALWKKLCPAFDALERQVGKRINFADLFRAGADKIRNSVYDDIGIWIPLAVFERAVRNRPLDRPLLWAWQEGLIADARRDGYLSLPLTGQSRSFLGGDKFDVNEIVNFPVQTTASNVLLRIQHYCSSRLPSLAISPSFHHIHLCCNTYDALLFDCRSPSALSEARSIIAEAMTWVQTQDYWASLQSLFGRTVPLTCDTKEIPS